MSDGLETNAPQPVVPETPSVGTPASLPQRWKLADLFFFLGFAGLWLLLSPLVTYVGYAVLRPILGWQVRAVALPENAFFAVAAQTIYYIPLLGYTYFLIAIHYDQPFWAGLRWKGLSWPRAAQYFMAGLGLALVSLLALALVPDRDSFPLEQLFASPQAAYVVGAFAILVAPFMEELVFRGVLFAFFENLVGLRFAIASTALLFAGLHVPEYWGAWHHAALILAVGLVFSAARGATGSLAPCVILHLAYNAALMVGLFFGTQHFRALR